ncbi:MAG: arylsulfatase [Planctomycetes bacterium]|nr:arylsulfatase [Planctomycetota bacterium]
MTTRRLMVALALLTSQAFAEDPPRAAKPNVLLILADDLGYGDVGCFGGERCKIPTPNIDRLAKEGLRFTDAHSPAAVCAPSRYALMTGRYAWRTRWRAQNLEAWGRPMIEADRQTLARLARDHGYRTACIGKWHLGWDWPIPAGKEPLFRARAGGDPTPSETQLAEWKKTFAAPLANGPLTRGFEQYFGVDLPNHPPFAFIDGERTVGVPTEWLPRASIGAGLASQGGPAVAGWKLDAILPALGERTERFFAGRKEDPRPFFLYLSLTAPHTPYVPSDGFRGKSGVGLYGDFVMETDAFVGRVLAGLEASGAANDTLVIFASDNGCASTADFAALAAKGHYPSGPWRGAKQDAWEGGHRVPFIVRWPGKVAAGTSSARTIGLVDLTATLADLLDAELPDDAAEDSVSLLPLLRGEARDVRDSLVAQSASGVLALRSGRWKVIFGPGSGAPDGTKAQLFDLVADPGEQHDVAAAHPEELARLTAEMRRQIELGRSTPGEPQANDVSVELFSTAPPKRK